MYFYQISQNISKEQFGGKSSQLALLSQKGYPVPESVFLSKTSYFDFINHNGITDRIKNLGSQTIEEQIKKAEELRLFVLKGAFPPIFEEELEQIIGRFYGPVCVRSSASGEDSSEHSFAGQYETLLNIEPTALKVGRAIREVWASQWTSRLIIYRLRNGLPLNQGMGVIIQSMLKPVYAGVAFSANPLCQTENKKIILEFVRGLGTHLVDGSRTPQSLTWDLKEQSWQPSGRVPAGYRERFDRLAELLHDLEREFDYALDVEWAIDKRQIWLLQVRPISNLQSAVEWTNENVGEVIPDVVTPYSWSILGPIANSAFARLLRLLDVKELPKEGLFGLFKGKVYFNSTAFNRLLAGFYVGERLKRMGPLSAFFYLIRLIPTSIKLILFLIRLQTRILKHLSRHPAELKRMEALSENSGTSLLEAIDGLIQLHQKTMFLHITCTLFAELYFQLLDKLSRWSFAEHKMISARRLLSGSTGTESARSGRVLRQIADTICKNETVRSVFLTTPARAVAGKLQLMPESESIRQAIDRFFVEFGYGALHEFELLYPRWQEDQSYIYSSLQRLVKKTTTRDWDEEQQQLLQKRTHLIHKTKKDLSLFLRLPFAYVLRKADFFGVQRENLKQAFIKAHFLLKKKLLKLSDYLELDHSEDIFFLKQEEITAVVKSGTVPREMADTIRQRRAERQKFLKYDHPLRIRQVGKRRIAVEEKKSVQAELRGIPCSAGVAEGTARIVLEPETVDVLPAGTILIARSANPGWTPLFVTVSGIVTEIGGALSHSAIIAREYGLPMIAAVPEATSKIKDGQRIRIDGTSGNIEILGA